MGMPQGTGKQDCLWAQPNVLKLPTRAPELPRIQVHLKSLAFFVLLNQSCRAPGKQELPPTLRAP